MQLAGAEAAKEDNDESHRRFSDDFCTLSSQKTAKTGVKKTQNEFNTPIKDAKVTLVVPRGLITLDKQKPDAKKPDIRSVPKLNLAEI